MRSKLMTLLTVVGAVTVLVLAANTVALATTGKAILAGKINTSTKVTSIVRTTPGTGLQVKTKSTANSPFAVNGRGKVVNLNADRVDGFEGGTRALSWTYTGPVADDQVFRLTGLAAGKYLVSYEVYMNGLSTADGRPVYCYVRQGTGFADFVYGGGSYSVETSSNFPVLNGTALMTQPVNGNLQLVCDVDPGATWSAPASEPLRITAIPLAGVTNKGAPSLP